MANILRVKRRAAGGAAGAPSSLANAELAFNEQDYTLYYGYGTGGAGGTASTIIPIAGSGAYVSLTGEQNVSGNKTWLGTNDFTGSVLSVSTQTLTDNTTKAASTAFVKGQGYLTADTGVTSVALSLPSIFDVSGSPVTTTGTLSASLTTQAAATVLAAPVSATGAPSFRSLVASDIPTLTASKISDFVQAASLIPLNSFALPTATVSLDGNLLSNLADPVSPQDAATKAYVDATSQGLNVKQAVRVTASTNLTLSGEQTVDGVALVTGDRILVRAQTAGENNGIYVVQSGAWLRSDDADDSTEVTSGLFTFVEEGLTFAASGWVLSTVPPITLGTTVLDFAQFSGAGTIEAGTGLTKSGNTVNVGTASASRIVVNSSDIDLATTGIAAGTYALTTVDLYGRVTAGSNPTTLTGYGITDAQPLNGALTSISGLTTSSNQIIYTTAPNTYATSTLSAFMRGLLSDVDAPTVRASLGLGSLATQDASNVNITGGSLTGVSIDSLVLDGGSF